MNVHRLLSKLRLRRTTPGSKESAPLSFKEMECLLNNAALSLFERYRPQLLDRNPLYLVPAVWGAEGSDELDPLQEEIQRTVTPLIHDLLKRLSPDRTRRDETDRIDYLLKGLFLYKMAYTVQYYLNCRNRAEIAPGAGQSLLERMEPAGRA